MGTADVKDPKPCKESRCVKISRVLPPDFNDQGTLFGGRLMAYIDDVASISASRHCRSKVVTASTDSVDFLCPITPEDSVCLSSYVTWTGTSSMEVFVKVVAEKLLTGERKIAATAFLTFVALSDEGRPIPVPPVLPQTPEEKKLYETAPARAESRRRHRAESHRLVAYLTPDKFWEVEA